MVEQQSLTEHLLAFNPDAIREATQHPFLKQAATGTLPSQSAISWLAQDRLYALSYVNFVSALLAKLQIPSCSNRTSTLQWRTADALIECLVNIKNELQLFEDVAKNQGWSHIFDVSRATLPTTAYKNLFAGAAEPSASLLRGMVTLWATEVCYLKAWRWARGQLIQGGGDVMREVFIPNWSSDEFEGFVKRLGDLVDEMGRAAGKEELRECEEVWEMVVWAEKGFWPDV